MINSTPQVMCFTIDFHKHFAQVLLPVRVGAHPAGPISAANIGQNLFNQNRTVSRLISMPRSCRRSSTLRNRAARLMPVLYDNAGSNAGRRIWQRKVLWKHASKRVQAIVSAPLAAGA